MIPTMRRDDGPCLPARLALLPAVRYNITHLIQRPGDFARSSDNRVGSRMDVLSTVLKTVKLEGALFYNAEFSSPWSFRAPASCLVAPYLSPEPRHVIIYHLLTHGRAYANVEDGDRILLSAGDIVVFPHGDPHIMGNGRDVEPRDHGRLLEEILSQGLNLARMGGGGEITRFICGYLVCDPQLSKGFLGGLAAAHIQGQHQQRQLRPVARELYPLLCRASRRFTDRKRNRGGKAV